MTAFVVVASLVRLAIQQGGRVQLDRSTTSEAPRMGSYGRTRRAGLATRSGSESGSRKRPVAGTRANDRIAISLPEADP